MNFDLTLQLGEKIMGEGGSGYGVSDLTDIKDFPFPGLSYGVTIMLALSPEIVSGIGDGPTRTYHDEYERVNGELARTGSETVRFLEGAGFRAVLLGPTSEQFDESTLSVPFPHKTAAIRAGVGWIGKSDLLVSEEFGSAFRMCTVLTDAPLTPGTPLRSHCAAPAGPALRHARRKPLRAGSGVPVRTETSWWTFLRVTDRRGISQRRWGGPTPSAGYVSRPVPGPKNISAPEAVPDIALQGRKEIFGVDRGPGR